MNVPAGTTEVALTVFGGNNLELGATDIPSGLSPDARDCAFLPGQVFTRPPLERFSTLGLTSQIIYNASFRKPDQTVVQFAADSLGGMYIDGAKIGQTKAGNRFFTCQAFNKFYIAASDGLSGADVPLQYTPEGYLDRVSQDGPGGAPTLANLTLPPTSLVTGATGAGISIVSATPIDPEQVQISDGGQQDYPSGGYRPPQYATYYTSLQVMTATPHGLVVGQAISISGNSLYTYNSTYVSAVDSASVFEVSYFAQSNATGTGGTVTPSAPLLVRNNNQVAATTAAPHNLQVGYQVVISGVADASQPISSIVIDNPTLQGIATVTTSSSHGLVPGEEVSIVNVSPANVGGIVTSWNLTNNILTMTTSSPHKLVAGDQVIQSTNGRAQVACVVSAVASPTTITINIPNAPVSDGSGTTATLTVPWGPASGQVFSVTSTPSPTTFEVAVTQGNGTWSTGSVTFPWNGTFYVTSVPSSVMFTYAQAGPNNSLASGTGTVTPQGQISPGQHKCVCIFQTRTGGTFVSQVSATVTCGGEGYLVVSNIPIGPANVVARQLAFTGASGGEYFVLPIAPKDPATGFVIGTATVIPDNTTTTAVLDFSDQALFSGIDIGPKFAPGNNLFRQVVLGPCLGFYSYASRLIAWGERNKIQQFINMGFEGGYYASNPTVPLGWTLNGNGHLAAGDYGGAFQFGTNGDGGAITQTAYQDVNGVAILTPKTLYRFRLWASGLGTVTATFYSPTVGILAQATAEVTNGFIEAPFSLQTPVIIPPDTVLSISSSAVGTIVDELEIIYAENPYMKSARVSYVINPEAFDGVTGILGSATDPHPIRGMEERRDVLGILTAGPNGSLYEVEDTASGEPVTWNLRHVSSKCGLVSAWAIAKFEDWFSWVSDTGLRIYDGGTVDKMSQEVQPLWDSFNPAATQFTVLANDPYTRRVYLLAVTGTATVSNETWVLDYRELNTAGALSSAGTLRIGMSGKTITTDLTRKWCPWSMTMNHCGVVALNGGGSVMTFAGGSGVSLATPRYSAVYTLNEGSLAGVDADYGAFWQTCSYPTYFFLSADEAEQRQLGVHRLHHGFMALNVDGIGAVYIRPMIDRLNNYARQTRAVPVSQDLARDLEFPLDISGERVSYRVCCQPQGLQPFAPDAQAGFRLSSLTVSVKTHAYSPIRGRNS